MSDSSRFIVGIDLGTTNCAVAYVDRDQADAAEGAVIMRYRVPQLTGPGEFTRLPMLPSFLYIPGEYDISRDAIAVPWQAHGGNFSGAFARDHGAKVPSRLVSSAKSWLCHPRVDKKAPILPWGSGDEIPRVSPVEATAAYLSHIKNAWNKDQGEDADLHLEHQSVVVTVPASFDEVARDLTVEAAQKAGLSNITLLEEPLAAFYSWLARHEKKWSSHVSPGQLILVCDVGGGTTDFTLITLTETPTTPRFERIAVGDHLILGGDNLDMALARNVIKGLKQKQAITGDQWKNLCHQCRQAKEALLEGKAREKRITLVGKGSRLIAGTITASLAKQNVTQTVLDAFFPLVGKNDPVPAPETDKGPDFGLPFEEDVAVTRHLGRFLERHGSNVERLLNRTLPAPDHVLFNGGSLKPELIRSRLREAVRHWFRDMGAAMPHEMDNPDPDLAVSIGAAYYGMVRAGRGVRVGSGSPRSYYLGVETGGQDQNTAGQQAVCLVERGLDEGSSLSLDGHGFEVKANLPVSFDLYSSSFRSGDKLGDILLVDDSLTRLPPLQTLVLFGKKGDQTRVPVQVEAVYTEMGTLVLSLKSRITEHKWRLSFQLRDTGELSPVTEQTVFDASVVDEATRLVSTAFAKEAFAQDLEGIAKNISELVNLGKEKWPLDFIRGLADRLILSADARSSSREHEVRWLNLTGFCMRPGIGEGFDPHRITQLWKIYRGGPVFGNAPQVRLEWWIFWRRLAAGLKPGHQRNIFQELSSQIFPKNQQKGAIVQEALEIWMMLANMEYLSAKEKIRMGRQLVSMLNAKKTPAQIFWSLSRIGAREPLYGPIDRVVSPGETRQWIQAILKPKWPQHLVKPLALALGRMARKTHDPSRDLDPDTVKQVLDFIPNTRAFEPVKKMVQTKVAVEQAETDAAFGEALPAGLILKSE